MESDVFEYFKEMSDEAGIPHQSLINLYFNTMSCKSSLLPLLMERELNLTALGLLLRIALSKISSIPKYNNRERLQQDSENPVLLDIGLNLCNISPTIS
jgi:hypothetical protein